jgi:endonuclease
MRTRQAPAKGPAAGVPRSPICPACPTTMAGMRLVIASCTVDYQGRLDAHLPLAKRLLLVKADGSISIHSDGGAYKPLNWMTPPCALTEGPSGWTVSNAKGEVLRIDIERIHADVSHDLGVDPGLTKDGVEAHLQELLAGNPGVLEDGLRLVRREYPTDIGPVDLLCRRPDGRALAITLEPTEERPTGAGYVAVEVKRRAGVDAVDQLSRYLERLNLDGRLRPVRGILAAQAIAPQAKVLAESRGIRCVVVDYGELQGKVRAELTLF